VSRRLDWEKANRKDVVHEQGAEPMWHDFPEEAPTWIREEFSSKKDHQRGRRSGRSAGPRQSRDLSGSYHRRVGPVSGGRQLGVWRRESDWRPTRTFRYCARAWPWRRSVVACRLDNSQPWDVFGAYRPPEPF
jgi:hypothetical protein